MYKGDISLLEEIEEQDFAFGAGCSLNTTTFTLSAQLGDKGDCCTATKECQPSCN
ncbi:plantaricin C family lantibiotic [Streptomyces scabiei]|uniref:plantaricin C family lantibiotic n=1 Tax=Streptomyces scabiei TaxID=1930 RepID=UPI00099C0140|nr:plantaricin C family lantibiotic [Streptomyces scabiei]